MYKQIVLTLAVALGCNYSTTCSAKEFARVLPAPTLKVMWSGATSTLTCARTVLDRAKTAKRLSQRMANTPGKGKAKSVVR